MHHFIWTLKHSKDQINFCKGKRRGGRGRKEKKNEERERKGGRGGQEGNVSNGCDLRLVIHCYSYEFW